MPWHVEKGGGTCSASEYAVIKDSDGSTVGCFPTQAAAQAKVDALYASETNTYAAGCGCDDQTTRGKVDNTAWDAGAAMSRCANSDTPGACYQSICAGRKAGDAAVQSSWALPHHKNAGGPPNAAGVRNALSRLPQTDGLTNREAARKHLEAHMSTIHGQAENSAILEAARRRVEASRALPEVQVRAAPPMGAARLLPFPSLLEVREPVKRGGQELAHIHGTATAYEQVYEMWDAFGPYKEGVRVGAGADSLAADPDVAFLVNHRGMTMARTTNGTLELAELDTGLDYDAYVNAKRSDVRDFLSAVEDRLITESSFAFQIEEGEWNDDYTEYWIKRYNIDRGDVSGVNYGANPYTSVAARTREIMADLAYLPAGAVRPAIDRLRSREDVAAVTPPAPQVEPGGMSLELARALFDK